MRNASVDDAAIAVVRRNNDEVQGKGNWGLFEELFADDFVDHTPQPGTTPDKDGVRVLYKRLRAAFPDFHPEIYWQALTYVMGAPCASKSDAKVCRRSYTRKPESSAFSSTAANTHRTLLRARPSAEAVQFFATARRLANTSCF